ncbi:MAG: Ribonuclease HII [Candidatus Azambacteria bacterium GW2011_GWA2_45_90]|uniref:Ribonuclease HII n=2 Tax=Candidatus Azamiibacteriota TaxID=1752741 RepID=A0A1F5BHN0_9BACT|nr:MAG: Ribonuclease HII [Candidatus Azambacteria bacterium GW2011_GWA2_45_90]OGD30107.1 MAG: ribonuclease HII [Candidatus Azambacteria bacterium RIFCSPHIGHO2_02_46_12]
MTLKQEKKIWKSGYRYVAGVDEVGRGALAGPVCAAAVLILNKKLSGELKNIKDSKQLTAGKREKFYGALSGRPDIVWSVALVSEKIIDKIGIDRATWLAMEKAVLKLEKKPNFLLIDGNRFSSHKLKPKIYNLIVRGDEKVFSIAAASVIAKVTRDRLMTKLSEKYAKYGFWKHKGYGTKEHFKAIRKYGISEVHRNSFLKS